MEPIQRLDVIVAADFTAGGDMGRRLGQEVRHLAGQGLRVGLLQTVELAAGAVLAPEARTCLRRGLARRVDPAKTDEAFGGGVGGGFGGAQLIWHAPAQGQSVVRDVAASGWRDVAVVCHTAADFGDLPAFGAGVPVVLHPVHAGLRAAARRVGMLCGPLWLPVAQEVALPAFPDRQAAVGWVGGVEGGAADLPEFSHVDLDGTALTTARVVAGIDILVLRAAADVLVAAMLASGRVVVADPALRTRYGAGPVYHRDLAAGVRIARAQARVGQTGGFVAACGAAPILRYGAGMAAVAVVSPRPEVARRPVLCLSSNGVGVGHLTRLLAIARRMDGAAEIVFATQAQAVGVVQSFGYRVEYIPSPAAVGGDFGLWDDWFAVHLAAIIDRYDPALVVYDGNHLSDGLIRAVASRSDLRLAWVRRGMWGKTTSAFMANARWCDLVIEPGELAGARDEGVTVALRGEAMAVDPIRLLDLSDLFTREGAAAHLGLNPARPAVLVQLGSGYQRDLLSMLDQIIGILSTVPGLQICVAEWVNGSVPLALWPEVTVLRGFPLSQYLRAFDFCISAAGYNSFHEVIGFAVPTVFVANRHPSIDDQYGRAKFAQDHSAAFEIAEGDLEDLAELLPLLMQDMARAYLAGHCRALDRPNGAEAAAAALLQLAGIAQPLSLAAE